MKKNWKLPMTFVMFMVGILLTSAIISLKSSEAPPSKTRSETLISMIEAQEEKQQELTDTIMAKGRNLSNLRRALPAEKKS